jgi:hypothetical protein
MKALGKVVVLENILRRRQWSFEEFGYWLQYLKR